MHNYVNFPDVLFSRGAILVAKPRKLESRKGIQNSRKNEIGEEYMCLANVQQK